MLVGDITLEPLSEGTLEFVRQVRSNPEVYVWLRDRRPITVEEQRAWFDKYPEQSEYRVYIGSRPDWFFGYSQLRQSAGVSRAVVGVCISPCAQGKGLGEALLRATIEKAWELELNELWAFIFSCNTRSIKLFEKCGFESCGPDEAPAESRRWTLRRPTSL